MEQIQITSNVSEQILEDTLTSALEGGIGCWASITGFKNKKPQRSPKDAMNYLPSYLTTPLSDDGILLLEDEEETTFELNRIKLLEGIKVMAQKYHQDFTDMVSENGDSNTGDVLVQCAIFGEVIYG